jgi:hypothetical protein
MAHGNQPSMSEGPAAPLPPPSPPLPPRTAKQKALANLIRNIPQVEGAETPETSPDTSTISTGEQQGGAIHDLSPTEPWSPEPSITEGSMEWDPFDESQELQLDGGIDDSTAFEIVFEPRVFNADIHSEEYVISLDAISSSVGSGQIQLSGLKTTNINIKMASWSCGTSR